MTDVTAVIVTYDSRAYIEACVRACLRYDLPIVVVDNGSSDDTVAAIPVDRNVTVIANAANRGFAAAVNQGVAACNTPLILLLNPDAELLTDIDPLRDACALERHTAVTGILVGHDGQAQQQLQFRRFPTPWSLAFEVLGLNRLWPGNSINKSYRYSELELRDGTLVEQPAAAFLMVRRDDWNELRGFDERFFPLWFEDVDYCRRFADMGGRVLVKPQVRARHFGGHSVSAIPSGCRARYWYVSLLRYAAKHYSPFARRMVAIAVVGGFLPRLFLGIALERNLKPVKVYWSLFLIAGRCVVTGEVGG